MRMNSSFATNTHNNSIMHYIDAEKYNKYMIRIRLKRFFNKKYSYIQQSKRRKAIYYKLHADAG